MGEGLDALDAQIMPYIAMANIACGGHAGNTESMQRTVKLAKEQDVQVGVHPSFKDKEGFGRKEIYCTEEEIKALIQEQCKALDDICKENALALSYVKPHGALYNMMMKEMSLFETVCKAVAAYDPVLKLMILSNTNNARYAQVAQKYNITLLYEVFADRAYTDEGQLVARSQSNALLETEEEVLQRVKTLHTYGYITSVSGKHITLQADILCVHSDTEGALALIETLSTFLKDPNAY
ncbi:MAG: 5-oxoprolinase subunit PxpA [Sulfurovum sp.]|nr:5-oxoprolinase subunit PxpA [Sulfurovum sp.]